jgi:hypothetical protein
VVNDPLDVLASTVPQPVASPSLTSHPHSSRFFIIPWVHTFALFDSPEHGYNLPRSKPLIERPTSK